ncbi:MAG: glycosyl transferase family 2, partial [Bryobacterales bacterium]|nr:glycosyl transferase family 2 [Bryobacterales bacterium]
REKVEAWFHLTPNVSYPMMVVVSFLMLPVMICRFYIGWLEMLLVDTPLIICSFWSVVMFYLLSQHELYPKTWKRSVFFLPALLAMGAALTISNTKAFLEAVFGVKTAFARTPKYSAGGGRPAVVEYKRRSGWLPFAEIGMGTLFVGMVAYSIEVMNFFALPFLLLFVGGYYWAGFSTLWQDHQGRLRFERERRRVEIEAAG